MVIRLADASTAAGRSAPVREKENPLHCLLQRGRERHRLAEANCHLMVVVTILPTVGLQHKAAAERGEKLVGRTSLRVRSKTACCAVRRCCFLAAAAA